MGWVQVLRVAKGVSDHNGVASSEREMQEASALAPYRAPSSR